MKHKSLLLAFSLLFVFSVLSGPPIVPNDIPWALAFDHDRTDSSDQVIYRLYSGTNILQTFSPTNYVVLGVTNSLTTIQLTITNLVTKGTNDIFVTAIDPLYSTNDESKSTNLTLRVVGKPLAPQGIRKL